MDKIKLIEKLIIIAFDVISFLTFCFIANLINSLFIGILVFSVFSIINVLIPENYRIHADRLLHCFILSLLFLFSCIIVYKIALNYMSNEESIILSILLVILANFSTTSFLWWKRNELNERVLEWVRFNLDNERIIEYKQQLNKYDKKKYIIFIYYFEENKSFETISKLMDIDKQRIGEEVSIMSHYIEYGIRLRWS